MKLIVGLGNVGDKYAATRHNLGFRVIDQIAEFHHWLPFKDSQRFKAEISEGIYRVPQAEQRLLLAKPTTMMNNSGEAVANLMFFYNIKIKDVWVIHDDLDLELGKLRIRQGGSSGGNNGVESVLKALGRDDFVRFRIGIKTKDRHQRDAAKFVLERFTKEEEAIIPQIITETAKSVMHHAPDSEIFDHTRNLLESES